MLYWLSKYWHVYFPALRVVHYITFRSILAALTALLISLLFGPALIRRLTTLQIGQVVRDDGPQTHLKKSGTPTMGGALILVAIAVTTLLWGDLSNHYIWLMLAVTLGYGAIGWVDDYRKLVQNNPKGLAPRWKLFFQIAVAVIALGYLYLNSDFPAATQLLIPYTKEYSIELGILAPMLSFFVIVGSSNAVNLTDGLDGLAIVPTIMVSGALGVFAYVAGNTAYAHYLALPYIPGVGEVAVFASAIVGAGLGFLWFNAYPAQIFMGDVGSLALGASLGVMAVVVRQELVLLIMGGLFVAETLSVIIQVSYFKMTRKRVFRMAPLHHHFELCGWPEPKVIVRFWIITVILVLCGLASLKLR